MMKTLHMISYIVAICSLVLHQIAGFSVQTPSTVAIHRQPMNFRPTSTCMFAEAAEDETTPTEQEGAAVDELTNNESKSTSGAADILNSPAFLKRKLEVLQKDKDAVETALEDAKKRLEEGKAEWGTQLEDLQKEYKNIQQRMNTQNNAGDNMATVLVARQLLGVLDIYDRAFTAITANTDEEKAIQAEYKEAYDMVLETFERLGVKQVETVGIEFDYENHQAVMQKPSDEYEEGIVSEELQKGFRCGDQLVRAAMVVVAA
jgi:molecular chaperone GrpE